MTVWIKRHKVATAVIVALAWLLSAWPRGAIMAHIDHLRGHDEVKTFGLPQPWRGEYRTLLRERYDVELNPVAGCMLSFGIVEYADGYNRVSKSYINRKHGRDIFEECAEEAQAIFEETRKANNSVEDIGAGRAESSR